MKRDFRAAMTWLHAWAGLVVGWLLFAVFLTGSLAVFAPEITRWMQPEARAGAASPADALAAAESRLRHDAAGAQAWTVELPSARRSTMTVAWLKDGEETKLLLDPATGAILSPRDTEGGDFFNRVHYELHAGNLGLWLVGFAGLVLFVVIVAGVIIHKRIFIDFFTFRPWAAAQRAWLDGHNVAGVMILPFLLMISYSGVTISSQQFLPASVDRPYDGDAGGPRAEAMPAYVRPPSGVAAAPPALAPLFKAAEARLGAGKVAVISVRDVGDQGAVFEAWRMTGDRIAALSTYVALDAATGRELSRQDRWDDGAVVHRTLTGLHTAGFGGPAMAWLYFLSGLTGCAVIVAGLVVYVEKRRKRRPLASALDRRFQRAAESINVAAVAGVMLASAVYLWSNRLIPAQEPFRAAWEGNAFFAAWALAFLHAALRPPGRAWVEQLGATAALCIATPVLNAATSDLALSHTIPAGDWASAGVDLACVVLGAVLALVAARLMRRAA